MNEPRKPTGEMTRSDPVVYSSNQEQPEIKHEIVSKIPKIRYVSEHVWKSFEIDKRPDTDNDAWLSMIYDLLHNLDDLARSFRFELQQRSWLNAYLLAIGISQVVEDYLHSKLPLFGKTMRYLQALPAPVGPILTSFAKNVNKYWLSINEKKRATRKLVDWQQKLAKLIYELAEVVINYTEPDEIKATGLVADGGTLMAYIPYFPVPLRQEIVRLPSCFRSYDQQPDFMQDLLSMRPDEPLNTFWRAMRLWKRNGGWLHVGR